MFEMKDDYLTGIDFVDKEHRKLFEIANDAYNALKDDYVADKFDQIVGIIQELKEYTGTLVELVDFLGNWLINHILVNDKRIDHI